ncbi:Chromo (Hypothetical proteinRromatin Organisation MOdifier) domain [Nesidiocoris tenuis]|uniref:Chromo domain-containing protein n=1 Tax=Nesidiocoris tenuis TaxID=355587 RepID=A0ABN7AWA6_9HEMI|nr:Chromo (Hypothetical proteinRromatin Organisation MOdifier) domain [Nesidiocoris tenuis]
MNDNFSTSAAGPQNTCVNKGDGDVVQSTVSENPPGSASALVAGILTGDDSGKNNMDTDDSVDNVVGLGFSDKDEQMDAMKDRLSLQSSEGTLPEAVIENLHEIQSRDETAVFPEAQSAQTAVLKNSNEGQSVQSNQTGEFTEDFPAAPEKVSLQDVDAAFEETKSLDVLICGKCHSAFNFLQEFSRHKSSCKERSKFKESDIERIPTIWAFLLFKNALVKKHPEKYGGVISESSWKLYQKWCNMPENARNTWVAAGASVMNYLTLEEKLGYKGSPGSKHIKFSGEVDPKRPVVMKKFCQRDQSGGMMKIRPGGMISSSDQRSSFSEDSEQGKMRLDDEDSQDIPIDNTLQAKKNALREEEFVVERIVSRRFNPRRKQYEYLLKWEGYPPEQNTWEPAENLEACQHLLKAFEESLNKQAMKKMKSLANQMASTSSGTSNSQINNFGRPVRSSKQKAMNQVKQWCGSIMPDSEIESMMKRPVADSDEEEDTFFKRMRMGSDSEDSVGLGINAKRGPGRPRKHPVQNGTPGSISRDVDSADEGERRSTLELLSQANESKNSNISPANQAVLVANAKGVVKVDPSQVPNLSSGVYIMSNKSGIIKLDSVSPSRALMMKQGCVKDISPIKSSANQPVLKEANLNKSSQIQTDVIQRSGIVRKSQLMTQAAPSPRVQTPTTFAGNRSSPIRQPPRQAGNIKVTTPTTNSNTRLVNNDFRSNLINRTVNRPIEPATIEKTDTRQLQTRIIRNNQASSVLTGSKPANQVRSGITRIARNVTSMPQLAPASPSGQPITFDNSTKIISKDESEAAADPAPAPMPTMSTATSLASDINLSTTPIIIKEEIPEKSVNSPVLQLQHSDAETGQSSLNKFSKSAKQVRKEDSNQPLLKPKESLLKKTLGKPGSIGSMTVSPKKSVEVEDIDEVVTITGDDGMIYKVSKAELHNSMLLAGGEHCVYLTPENGDENATLIPLDTSSYSEQVNQIEQVNVLGEITEEDSSTTQLYMKDGDGEEGELMDIQVQGQEATDDDQSQLVAQLVEAGEPAPGGGPRSVVLLLPDGNIMMTEVDEEQYAALELDKFQGQTAEME